MAEDESSTEDDPSKSDDSENEDDSDEPVHLSDQLDLLRNKQLTEHGNVFEGKITNGNIGAAKIQSCAIKISDQKLLKEGEVLRNLIGHPHVITLLSSGNYERSILRHEYIVLELCDKLNLRQRLLHRKQTLPVFNIKWALKFCRQIIDGVTFVHDKLIIHKDLSPSNILLTHDLENIKIADFGSSQEVKTTSSMVYCPNTFGTLGFRPPESFGNSYISLRSDTFSLGALFYFLLSNGESPFGQQSDLWDYNTSNGLINLCNLKVKNPLATRHLITLMLQQDRVRRPTIKEIARHPCWDGEERVCDFDYGVSDETDDGGGEKKDDEANDEDGVMPIATWLHIVERRPLIVAPAGDRDHGDDKGIANVQTAMMKSWMAYGEGKGGEEAGCSLQTASHIQTRGHFDRFGDPEPRSEARTCRATPVAAQSRAVSAVKNTLNRGDRTKTSGQFVPRFFPCEAVTKVIKGEDKIWIGGCLVSFPAGAFDGPQTVSLKAEIDSKKWPFGKRAITPSLLIDVKNLKKPLSIKLPTWCFLISLFDHHEEIDIMRSNDGDLWETIETVPHNYSGFIEFKCQHFSYVVAVIRGLALFLAGLKPAVYIGGRDIVVTLSVNVALYTDWLTKRMKEELGPDVKQRSFNSVVSDGSEVFHSSLSCEGFVIRPSGPYEHSVEDILATGEASVQCCHLPIHENEPIESTVEYTLEWRGRTIQRQCFGHSWSPSPYAAQGAYVKVGEGIYVYKTSNRDDAEVPRQSFRDLHLHGDGNISVHGASTSYDGNVIKDLNNGTKTENHEGTRDVMSVKR